MHIDISIYIYTHIDLQTCIYTYTYTSMCIHTCLYTYTYLPLSFPGGFKVPKRTAHRISIKGIVLLVAVKHLAFAHLEPDDLGLIIVFNATIMGGLDV